MKCLRFPRFRSHRFGPLWTGMIDTGAETDEIRSIEISKRGGNLFGVLCARLRNQIPGKCFAHDLLPAISALHDSGRRGHGDSHLMGVRYAFHKDGEHTKGVLNLYHQTESGNENAEIEKRFTPF